MEDISENTTERGRKKEEEAQAWLSENKPEFRTIGRNFRRKFGEIDLICEIGEELVFIEIRWRSGGAQVTALESITYPKQRRILQAARAYLCTYKGRARSVRFDVLAFMEGQWVHVENAFGEGQ